MEEVTQVDVKPLDKGKVKNFLRVMWYLAAITAFEFAIAFTVPHEFKWLRIVVFVALTLVKAYYIVTEFMHLGHEKRSLKMSIVLPTLFVIFLIFVLLFQANALFEVLN